jgi:hypothetical protein
MTSFSFREAVFARFRRRISMADNYCTQCGERLRPEARFCPRCGAKVEPFADEPGVLHGFQASRSRLEPLSAGFLRESESREENVAPWGLTTKDLDYLVACSLASAVMDTSLLLVRDSKGIARWMPLNKMQSMQGLDVEALAIVDYHIGDSPEPFCLPGFLRDDASSEVWGTFLASSLVKPFVNISISLQFRPVDYGDLTGEITGKWATVVNDQGVNDVRAILQMPFSGQVLKQRLQEQEAALQGILETDGQDDPASDESDIAEQMFGPILTNLRAVLKLIPDGDVDHMYCVASVIEAGQDQSAIQSDPPPDAKSLPSRRDLSKRISKALKAGNPGLFKRKPARFTAARPLRNPLLRGMGRGWGHEASGRVRGYLRSDR